MRLRILISVGLVACAGSGLQSAAASPTDTKADIQAVRATFRAYLKALRDTNGKAAAGLVDRNTLAYYERMKNLALHGKESQVRPLPILDKIVVLRTRHQVPLRLLRTMNTTQYFAHAVRQDWMDSASASRLSPGVVEVTGRRATVYVLRDAKPTPMTFAFSKEAVRWKIDLTSFFAVASAAFKAMVLKGQSQDEYILSLLETTSGKKPAPTIWQPVIPQ